MSTTENTIAFQLREKVTALEDAMLHLHPTMPYLLREIHTQLRADPELVTTLSDEEVGCLVRGLKLQTNTIIAAKVVKESKASSGKKLAATSVDDI